ncbi:MAG: exonuclease domain-containing protein [Rhodoferax sp.]|nr:exonuclease domain-containing protein [Rhodoferax sp.]
MKRNLPLLLALVAVAALLLVWGLLAVALLLSTLVPAQQQWFQDVLLGHWPVLVLSAGLVVFGAGVLLAPWLRRLTGGPARLLEQTRLLLAQSEPHVAIPPTETLPHLQSLADAIHSLAGQRDILRHTMHAQIADAARGVQREKNRLAALVAELSQSVVVCNMDGRIMLYNHRARLQFKTLSPTPALAGGAELMGIGRSIYSVIDRQWVQHALDSVHQRMARGAAHPSSQFVITTHSGQLLRVQLAPVQDPEGGSDAHPTGMGGFVLMLDNVTRSFEEEARHDQWLSDLSTRVRSSLSGIHVALEKLESSAPEATASLPALRSVRDDVGVLRRYVDEQARQAAASRKARWLQEDVQASDLAQAARQWIQTHWACPLMLDAVDSRVWLRVDSYSLLQALTHLAGRVVEEFDARFLQLRAQAIGDRAHLDLVWTGSVMSTETVMGWEINPMQLGHQTLDLSVRDVVERHGADFWFERERASYLAFFRFSLPALPEPMEITPPTPHASRPEYYDFDFFGAVQSTQSLDDQRLSEMAFTVFDTETTGLNPAEGDEIIQIGATRIVHGKLLSAEFFDQLVDPGRRIPAATIPIHGITQDMVEGRPRIAQVLPAFHAFALDTVLVAHNAAFDMKFLQLQEAKTGVAFHQPVLDTLLLSAVVHPNQSSHRLEAIAERFGITVQGRHTALGDARVTAQIWLRLIPLLQAMGIQTLGEARAAAQKTYYARLKY